MARVYISGGITGVENYEEIFKKKQEELEKKGYEVLNPAKLGLIMPKSATWQEYMNLCIPMLEMCDMIFMLDGWEKSKVATEELKHAVSKNIIVCK